MVFAKRRESPAGWEGRRLTFEILTYFFTFAVLGAVGLVLFVALRQGTPEPSAETLGLGRFGDTLALADTSENAERSSLYNAAVAAKHLLDWETAERLLRRILREDDDGEAWLELGLTQTYQGDYDEALHSFDRAEATRADLFESLTLHRAFVAMRRGESSRARVLFEEVEVPLETKLRTDIGGGEPLFLEWFLQSAALWRAAGKTEKAAWAADQVRDMPGDSRLSREFGQDLGEH